MEKSIVLILTQNWIWTSNPNLWIRRTWIETWFGNLKLHVDQPGPGPGVETPIFGFEEPGLRPGLGTSSSNHGSGLQTLNLGFEEEEEEEEEGWDLVREPQATP